MFSNIFVSKGEALKLDRKLIQCNFLEARDLINIGNGTEPELHAYLFIDLGNGRKVNKEEYTTRKSTVSINPTWKENFTFGYEYDLFSELVLLYKLYSNPDAYRKPKPSPFRN